MPTEFQLKLPLFVGGEPKKNNAKKSNKRFWFTLNNYRNWHYQTSNNVKVKFKKAIELQVSRLPDLTALWNKVQFHYVYYAPDKAIRDLNNVVGVIDKFFADALVELGKLEDDNYNFVPAYSCEFGSIDKDNPRLEVFIRPYCQPQATGANMASITAYTPRKVTPQNECMLPSTHNPETRKSYVLIHLSEEEIAEAVRNYIRAQIPSNPDAELPVKFVAGRGENGITGSITVDPLPVSVVHAQQPTEVSATFDAVASEIAEAVETDRTSDQASEVVIEDTDEATTNTGTPAEEPNEPETDIEETTEKPVEAATETTVTEDPTVVDAAPERKKSNLFAQPESVDIVAEKPQAPTAETLAPADNPPVASKPRSIFD